jgi:hypothetical protein
LPDVACDVELVELAVVPVVVVLELDGLDVDELVALELDAGADELEDGADEPPECVELGLEPASGSMYCWSPADEPLASTVPGASNATVTAAIRQMISLRGMSSGEVLHSTTDRALDWTLGRKAISCQPATGHGFSSDPRPAEPSYLTPAASYNRALNRSSAGDSLGHRCAC